MTEDVMIVAIVFGVAGVVLFPLVRAWGRRLESRGAPPAAMSTDVTARLERIERAVESVAVEVERISEGQRFVTKVLADRAEIPKLPPAQH
ncbi:MAG TPA: hypothetical protein VF368_06505 [Gemmatimonadaceae bacterium]|jgi:hypothetical protein